MLTQSRVEDNGNLTLVANPNTLRHDILQLDLDRAHHCTQLTASMKKQVRFAAALLLCSCPRLICGLPQQPCIMAQPQLMICVFACPAYTVFALSYMSIYT